MSLRNVDESKLLSPEQALPYFEEALNEMDWDL